MTQKLTRVDTDALLTAVTRARALLEEVRTVLRPVLVTDLSEDERRAVVRAPVRLPDAARDLAALSHQHAPLAEAVGFDAGAVLEDVANHEALAGLAATCAEIEGWIDDSDLVWLGEAYVQSLELYQAVRPLARRNGSLQALVDPLAEVFAARRSPKAAAK